MKTRDLSIAHLACIKDWAWMSLFLCVLSIGPVSSEHFWNLSSQLSSPKFVKIDSSQELALLLFGEQGINIHTTSSQIPLADSYVDSFL